MSLTLSPETEAIIQTRMERDGYPNADQMVRVALDVLRQVEDEPIDDREVAEIRASIAQMRRGETIALSHSIPYR